MAYIGNTATTQAFTPAVDYFNGNGSTVAFTLSKPVASVAQVQAVIENVPQNPGSAYTVSGNTITFTSAPPSGTANIYVYYTSPITQVIAPSQGTVSADQIASNYALWNKSGSDINYTAGNVGIGTASPAVAMDVSGQVRASSGILFGTDTAAANALDDYEEGTWTPTVAGTTTAGTATYVSQQGTYLKVGGLVFFRCYLNWNSGTGTGNIRFNGLPFTCAGYTAVTIAYPYDFALSANKYLCNGYIEQSSTYFNALEASLGGGTVNAIPYDAAGEIMVSGCYRV